MTASCSVEGFFDKTTSTITYVAYDPVTKDAVVIDPVLDFDQASSICTSDSVQKIVQFIKEHSLKVHYVLETHAHADHLSGAQVLVQQHLPKASLGIGERITIVQKTFKKIYHLSDDFRTDGSQFARLFHDNEAFGAGSLTIRVLFTPGHTPACVSYLISDAVFTGDALFMPDSGTGRCDFPDGSAGDLYHSVHERLYHLPDQTRVFVGHDYQPNQRALLYQTTIGASKAENIQLRAQTTEAEYVAFRTKRDATLSAPRLLYPSIQVNIAAGALPRAEENGHRYLKIPIAFGSH